MPARPKRKAVDDTAQRAKKARGETDLSDELRWTNEGKQLKGVYPLLVLSSAILTGRNKVAGFDIDFTVIKTASGRKFAAGAEDWAWWSDCVPEKLRTLNKDGYRIVFFTNQAGIEKNKVKPETIKNKIEAIIKELDIPVQVLISTGNSHFRKPSPLMWDHFVSHCNQGLPVDKTTSLYVGDAAGRAKDWAKDKPKDFSCSDRMFAANIGIILLDESVWVCFLWGSEFFTPEEFFLEESPAEFNWGSINPVDFLKTVPLPKTKKVYHKKEKEVIVMVGCPASGKSTFRKHFLEPHGYFVVNRDTMGTMEKCIKAAKEALKNGKSIVSDNTNSSVSAREAFVELAKKEGIPCRCFWMSTSLELAHHLNLVRQNQTNGEVRRIPDVGYNVYKKNFEEPTKEEGFSEIEKISFIPRFDKKRDEEIFKQWTTAGH